MDDSVLGTGSGTFQKERLGIRDRPLVEQLNRCFKAIAALQLQGPLRWTIHIENLIDIHPIGLALDLDAINATQGKLFRLFQGAIGKLANQQGTP